MEQGEFLGLAAGLLLLSVLFFPVSSKFISYVVVFGLMLGVWWFVKL